MRFALAALPLLLIAPAAQASNDAAWAKFNFAVAQKCATASGLRHAHVSNIIGFDDSLGKVATLVTGIYPQARKRGATGKMLCVFDKRTQRAWVDEASGWSAPDLR